MILARQRGSASRGHSIEDPAMFRTGLLTTCAVLLITVPTRAADAVELTLAVPRVQYTNGESIELARLYKAARCGCSMPKASRKRYWMRTRAPRPIGSACGAMKSCWRG